MTSRLDISFLRMVVVMTGFHPKAMRRTEAALLMMGLTGVEFTAAELPDEITDGNRHVAGAATGALISEGLLQVVGRVKSPNPDAKGRKLDVLRLVSVEKAKSWLRVNDFKLPALAAADPQAPELFMEATNG